MRFFVFSLLIVCTMNTLSVKGKEYQDLSQVATIDFNNRAIVFKPNLQLPTKVFFEEHLSLLKLSKEHSFVFKDSVIQNQGTVKSYRFQQKSNDIPIEGAEGVAFEKNKSIQKIGGNIIQGLKIDTRPTLSEEDALQQIFSYLQAEEYAWENASFEKLIKHIREESTATFCPKGELAIVSPYFDENPKHYRLAYKFDIFALQPYLYQTLYVDAHDGSIVTTMDKIAHLNANCTGETRYGSVSFQAEWLPNEMKYRLRQGCNGNGIESTCKNIEVFDSQNQLLYDFIDFLSSDSDWEGNTTAVETYWALSVIDDYFKNIHGRASYDNENGKMMAWVNFGGEAFVEPFYNGLFITIPTGNDTYNNLSALDVVAHESAHAFIQHSAQLIGKYETGALAEGIADIFATLVEHYVQTEIEIGVGFDWTIGEDIMSPPIRSLENPTITGQPTTYDGDLWVSQDQCIANHTNDKCGIHTNCGIVNYWFYLLSEGGEGINDNNNSYNITGIGIDNAAGILYKTVNEYLWSTAQYADMRNATIWTTQDIYGANHPFVGEVCAAWDAVGMYGNNCSDNSTTLTVLSPNGGENFVSQEEETIEWETNGSIDNVKIEYSLDGAYTWLTLVESTANTGTYEWDIPDAHTTVALIRVSDVNDATSRDQSDAHFSIRNCTAFFLPSTTTICENEILSFLSIYQEEGVSYLWEIEAFANSSILHTSNDNALNYSFEEDGIYIVRLTTSNGNCSSIYEEYIEVYSNPIPYFGYTNFGNTVQFLPTMEEGTASFSWDFGDGDTSEIFNPTHSFVGGETHIVTLSVVNDCDSLSFQQIIDFTNFEDCMYANIYGNTENNTIYTAYYDTTNQVTYTTGIQPHFAKFDLDGTLLFAKTYSTTNIPNSFISLVRASNGDFLLSGTTPNQSEDYFVLRVDSMGSTIWSRTYDNGSKRDRSPHIVPSIGDTYIISGWWQASSGTIDDVQFIRINGAGGVVWSKTYNMGGDDQMYKAKSNGSGGCIVVGNKSSSSSTSFILEIDLNGDLVQKKNYHINSHDVLMREVMKAADGHYVVAGEINNNATDLKNGFIAKLDSTTFDTIWVKEFLANSEGLFIRGLIQDDLGNYYITGSFQNTSNVNELIVAQFDVNGNFIWVKKTMGNGIGYEILNLPNNELLLSGFVENTKGGFGSRDAVLAKLDNKLTSCVTTRIGSISADHSWIISAGTATSMNTTINTGLSAFFNTNEYSMDELGLCPNICTLPCPTDCFFTVNQDTILVGGNLTLSTTCAANQYQYFQDGVLVAGTANASLLLSEIGVFDFTLVTYTENCHTTSSQEVVVLPTASQFSFEIDTLWACGTGGILLEAGITDMKTYNWTFEGNNVGLTPTIIVDEVGFYTLMVSDWEGNTAIDSIYVDITDCCVYPGDTNNDGQVNQYDLLFIGGAFGRTGSARFNSSLDWLPQAVPNWIGSFPNDVNHKHPDVNGDGRVGIEDTIGLHKNFGKEHGNSCNIGGIDDVQNEIEGSPLQLDIQVLEYPTAANDYTLSTNVQILGHNIEDGIDAYGIGYQLDYFIENPSNNALTSSVWNDPYIDFSSSTLGNEGEDLITFAHYDTTFNSAAIAQTRINHQDGNYLTILNSFNIGLKITNIATLDSTTGSFVVEIPNDSLYIALSQVQMTACGFPTEEAPYGTLPVGGDTLAIGLLDLVCKLQRPVVETSVIAADCGGAEGLVEIQVTNSPPPYDITWTNQLGESNNFTTDNPIFLIANLSASDYELSIVDANGCVGDTTFQVLTNNQGSNCLEIIPTDITFQSTYSSDSSFSVQKAIPTLDKGMIWVGTAEIGNTSNIFVAKLDANGDVEWSQSYGGIENSIGSDILSNPTGTAYYVIGYGEESAYFLKIDNTGNVLIHKKMLINEVNDYYINHISYTIDEHLLITGTVVNTENSSINVNGYLSKMDTTGTVIWENKYMNIADNTTIGVLNKTLALSDRTYLSTGAIVSDNGQNGNNVDAYLLYLDKEGEVTNAQKFGIGLNSSWNMDEIGLEIVEGIDGSIMIGGQITYEVGGRTNNFSFLIKSTLSDGIIWSKVYNHSYHLHGISSIIPKDNGEYWLGSGNFSLGDNSSNLIDDAYIFDVDSIGTLKKATFYGQKGDGLRVAAHSTGEIIGIGNIQNSNSNLSEIQVIQLDKKGSLNGFDCDTEITDITTLSLDWDSAPLQIEAETVNSLHGNILRHSPKIIVHRETACFTAIQPIVQNASCFGSEDGCIKLMVEGGTYPYTFNWSNGKNEQNIFDLSADNYVVTVTDANNASITLNIEVEEPALFEVGAGDDQTICQSETAYLQASSVLKKVGYQWKTEQEQIVSNRWDAFVNPNITTTYILTTENINNCISIDTVNVFVNEEEECCTDDIIEIYAGNTNLPSIIKKKAIKIHTGVNLVPSTEKSYLFEALPECDLPPIPPTEDSADNTVAKHRILSPFSINVETSNFSAYPNPFVNQISFAYTLEETSPVSLLLYDNSGRMVKVLLDNVSQIADNYKITFTPCNLPIGTYIAVLEVNNTSHSLRIVKTH